MRLALAISNLSWNSSSSPPTAETLKEHFCTILPSRRGGRGSISIHDSLLAGEKLKAIIRLLISNKNPNNRTPIAKFD